ncbi:hypothetical protein M0638_20425 [Roseomonas sp. NAR14]|uniref:Uncharacterized protein n=1 Tax=Roseomonas acroporae TaxID=2937791 RepID=A0A9X1YAW1_9PROT|nr:hypothetical protein [Roseomonas acroporae]MCK8786741.1 hypothetical protein [Roseomonas acroporae]
MTPADVAMRARVLALLPQAEAEWLARQIPPPPEPIKEKRREAVRAAIALFGTMPPTVAAKALSRAWDTYLIECWPGDRERDGVPLASSVLRRALFRLTMLSDGRSLGWRRIHDLASDTA